MQTEAGKNGVAEHQSDQHHKTKDILWVMRLLGHKSLETTLIYIETENAMFGESNDEFTTFGGT